MTDVPQLREQGPRAFPSFPSSQKTFCPSRLPLGGERCSSRLASGTPHVNTPSGAGEEDGVLRVRPREEGAASVAVAGAGPGRGRALVVMPVAEGAGGGQLSGQEQPHWTHRSGRSRRGGHHGTGHTASESGGCVQLAAGAVVPRDCPPRRRPPNSPRWLAPGHERSQRGSEALGPSTVLGAHRPACSCRSRPRAPGRGVCSCATHPLGAWKLKPNTAKKKAGPPRATCWHLLRPSCVRPPQASAKRGLARLARGIARIIKEIRQQPQKCFAESKFPTKYGLFLILLL